MSVSEIVHDEVSNHIKIGRCNKYGNRIQYHRDADTHGDWNPRCGDDVCRRFRRGMVRARQCIVNDFGNEVWLVLNNFALTSIPLFILLGEMLLRSDITEKMYHSLSLWLSRLPGGLLHTNIGACALMAATSGSSVATAATLGVVAIPTMMAKGYNERMLLGSVCAGGTLGILIPPSINMIIYGSISNTSIGKLFIAGVIPGILLAVSFSVVIGVIAIIKPSWVGGTVEPKTSFMDKLRTIPAFLPPR